MRGGTAFDMEEDGMRKVLGFAIAVILVGGLGSYTARAAEDKGQERYELAELLERTKVSLAQGLMASESEGTPISGKFEVEDGKLQLSVYTMRGDKFSEVIVDHTTGKVAKVEAITSGDDLTAATAQSAAMAAVKSSLGTAVNQAVQANTGFAAVSVTPSLKEGRQVADVTLINDEGQELKTVSEPLS